MPGTRDVRLLFAARFVRLFAFGFLSITLALYLARLGHDPAHIGLLFTLALAGDVALSLWLTTHADRFGRRRMLMLGAALIVLVGLVFAGTETFWLLAIAAIVGVISPGGNEIGPFLSIEQAALTHVTASKRRTGTFAWYNLAGSAASAFGALCGGALLQALQQAALPVLAAHRVLLVSYSALGVVILILFARLSPAVEVAPDAALPLSTRFGLHRSAGIVAKLSALFALDSFAGGFIVQSLLALWFHKRFNVDAAALGAVFFAANILAALSFLAAARIAARIGLINTMVFTHIPSNLLLIAVPFMPTFEAAVTVLLVRYCICQMDVPTRQSYTMAVVSPDERSAAGGVTGVARSVGSALSPALSGMLLGSAVWSGAPLVIAGALKIVYDVLLYRSFKAMKPPEERESVPPGRAGGFS